MMWMLLFTVLPVIAISYISWHVWCLLPLSWIWKILIIVLIAGSFFVMFSTLRRSTDQMPLEVASTVYEIGTSSVFILLYVFMLFLLLDLGRLVHLLPRTLFYNNWWTAGGIVLFISVLFFYGNQHYQHKYREELNFSSEKVHVPKRIVMVSDLHLGYHNRREELRRWVDMINKENPDLILITGDIIDGSIRPLKEERMYEEFRRLKASVYACLGNHEYYSGEPGAKQFYEDAGIHLLQDSIAEIGELCVIGRDDRTNKHRKSLGAIMKQVDRSKFCVLLDHQPYHLEQAEKQQIDLQLSGHTHHGQVWPISWITESIYECAFGSHKRGHTNYYISSGLGIWGGKFRIGTRSEYVVVNLR